jgi:anti-sigma B factor antagonist
LSTPPEFAVSAETTSPGVLTVRIVGELDMSTSPRVEEAMSSTVPPGRVIVDLTRCTFVDSSGIRLLMAIYRNVTSGGGRVELVASDPNVVRVLEITNVNIMMPIHSTPDAGS